MPSLIIAVFLCGSYLTRPLKYFASLENIYLHSELKISFTHLKMLKFGTKKFSL